MSWIEKLHKTYENNAGSIGDRNDEIPLLPVCHTTQKAHISIVINGLGNFVRASVVPKTDARTLIPSTEDSAGRTSGTTPHPLCDKLQYVARDYAEYGGDKEVCHEKYIALLKEWILFDKSQPKLKSVYDYVAKGHVIADLIKAGVLHVDTSSGNAGKKKLINQWAAEGDAPSIFKLLPGGIDSKGKNKQWQADAFVRWSVEVPENPQSEVWTDKSLWKSWQTYYSNLSPVKGLCYVTGADTILASQHPAKIRNDGDKAKLISSNDLTGYTFRGRFTTANEACGVSFDVTQKAHNALRWLIGRQSWQNKEQAIIAWAVSGGDVPDPFADTASLFLKVNIEPITNVTGDTAQEIGVRLAKLLAGYSTKLGATEDIVVMRLDSATTGRMAIRFYRELTASLLLNRVQQWHENCCWLQRFGNDKVFVGAPSPRDIAETAYGKSLDSNRTLRNATVERLLPCIIDSVAIPHDLLESCVRRASNRTGIESWEWEKTLGITCALFRYQHNERRYTMALEHDRNTRDYLYGRLLALAEHLESRALYVGGEKRETNAGKLMQRFAERPFSTWLSIETSLTPYKVRLRGKRSNFLHRVETEMDSVHKSFNSDDYISDKRLTGEFLLGYHCQRAELRSEVPSQEVDDMEDVDVAEQV